MSALDTFACPQGHYCPAGTLYANQYLVMKDMVDDSHTGIARRLADTDHAIPIHGRMVR